MSLRVCHFLPKYDLNTHKNLSISHGIFFAVESQFSCSLFLMLEMNKKVTVRSSPTYDTCPRRAAGSAAPILQNQDLS